mgnify:CR=1 FL=1
MHHPLSRSSLLLPPLPVCVWARVVLGAACVCTAAAPPQTAQLTECLSTPMTALLGMVQSCGDAAERSALLAAERVVVHYVGAEWHEEC